MFNKGSNVEKITIPDPSWGSNLANVILDLEKLRTKRLTGDVPAHIFFQLKEIFHILETLGSARIEGNNTTLAEYVEQLIENENKTNEYNDEIKNLDIAIAFIEENVDEESILNRAFISEVHKVLTKGLTPPPNGEGAKYPGELRKHDVSIKSSGHMPPNSIVLPSYFEMFLEFINADFKEQYQLLMVAVAHHRFEYIHPFDNGNGRMGRLLNYAFLIKLGFKVKTGRIINPSSVFYTDRDRYYDMLSNADSLTDKDILQWCEYFLLGLKNEIEKIDSLLNQDYVKNNILLPALKLARQSEHVTAQEFDILEYLINKSDMAMKSQELESMGITSSKQKSAVIKKLKDKGIMISTEENGRVYTLKFTNNYLLRNVIKILEKNGFISDFLNTK